MTAPTQRDIDWPSAEVEDGTLTVELTGTSSKGWKQRFQSVLALLETAHSRWGQVRLERSAIKVAEVQPGAETELRHFLESVALQVNSELDQPEQTKDAAEQAEAEHAAHTDRQMTAAFRSFADAD